MTSEESTPWRVMCGLDPHPSFLAANLVERMDCRVKPGNDGNLSALASIEATVSGSDCGSTPPSSVPMSKLEIRRLEPREWDGIFGLITHLRPHLDREEFLRRVRRQS